MSGIIAFTFEFKKLFLELDLLCALSQRKNLKILTKNKEIKKVKVAGFSAAS